MTLFTEVEAHDVDLTVGFEELDPEREYHEWVAGRCSLLLEDGATAPFVDGWTRCALGMTPDHERFVGDPFGSDDYHAGYDLAECELGPIYVVRNATGTERTAA